MFRAVAIGCAAVCALGLGTLTYTKVAARTSSGTPPPMLSPDVMADRIVVEKSLRKLTLLRSGVTLKEYAISLGGNGDGGAKKVEGDEKTPEGIYKIDWRNPKSVAHLSLHISYPSPEDAAKANELNMPAGGDIMIHGLPNGWGFVGNLHLLWDWTNGCIAVDNEEMQEIWSMVPDGTEIQIRP